MTHRPRGTHSLSRTIEPPSHTQRARASPSKGENNLFADAGNVLDKSGYACLLQQQMASWRAAWSMVPNTTPTTAPYGIVQLADATDEGWGCNMRQMCGNFDIIFGPCLAYLTSYDPPRAPCGVLHLVHMRVGCGVMLAIRCYAQLIN